MSKEQFLTDLKASSEYDELILTIGEMENKYVHLNDDYKKNLMQIIFNLCGYAYSMGEAQGHYKATGDWKY